MPGAESVRPPFKKRRNPLGGAAVFGTNVDSLTAAIDYAPNAVLASRTVLSVGKTRVRRFATPGVGESWIRVKDWSGETVADWKPVASVRVTLGTSYIRAALDQRIDLSVLAGIGEFDDAQRGFGIFAGSGMAHYPTRGTHGRAALSGRPSATGRAARHQGWQHPARFRPQLRCLAAEAEPDVRIQ